MLVHAFVTSLEPVQRSETIQVGRDEKTGMRIFKSEIVPGQFSQVSDGRTVFRAMLSEADFVGMEDGKLVTSTCLEDRETGKAYRIVVSPKWLLPYASCEVQVILATPEEREAASRGLLGELRNLDCLRGRLVYVYEELSGSGLFFDAPATGARADRLYRERDELEASLPHAREAHARLVRQLRETAQKPAS